MEKSYRVFRTKQADKDFDKIRKSGLPSVKEKVERIFRELAEHPRTGVGNPEELRHFGANIWSRSLSKKDRVVYEIRDDAVVVLVFQLLGHYDDR